MQIVIARFYVKPESRGEFLQAAREFLDDARQRGGVTSTWWTEDIENHNTFVNYCEYISMDAMEAHGMSGVGDFLGKIGLLLSDVPDVYRYDPDVKVRMD
ncbi:MAG: antibiotic biosynthesis monooxygenase family protein [Chloroflexota bacterium]